MCVSCAHASTYATEVPSELLSAMGRGVAGLKSAGARLRRAGPPAARAAGFNGLRIRVADFSDLHAIIGRGPVQIGPPLAWLQGVPASRDGGLKLALT